MHYIPIGGIGQGVELSRMIMTKRDFREETDFLLLTDYRRYPKNRFHGPKRRQPAAMVPCVRPYR